MNNQQKEILQAQLDSEKQTIKELKQVYNQALKDVNEKISLLSARADMNPPELQSIIYQKQYQQAIKGQLEGIMANLQSNEYATISDYLTRCYQDGYVGTMYDIAGQGIPLIIPIDQEQVTKAIQTDSKLSKNLYDRLGEDVSKLKTSVRAEISRGIANGSSWVEVGAKISKSMKNTPFEKAINNSIRIARTEGHRIQNQATLDAQHKAKSKGADVVKQWDATLDGATRETHRKLDGQIREIDEPFEVDGMKADCPGGFGDPAEDCNCRCALLQRARWALDESELETLKERAEYFDLTEEKVKDFKDYEEKFLGISKEDIEGADSGSVRSDEQKINNQDLLENNGKSSKIELENKLHTRNDPMVEVMGAANENNKEELQDILSKLNELGVEVEYRTNEYAYEIIGKGIPGRIIIDKNASLSAWLHEYQHALDDYNAGWSSMRIMKNPAKRFRREQRAYQVEIDLAKELGNDEMVIRLERLMEEERKLIYGE